MKWHTLTLGLLLLASASQAQGVINEGDAAWRISTLRATAGQWRQLKVLIESQGEAGTLDAASGRRIPFRIRHSQGDQWDFMLLQPLGDLATYFSSGTAHDSERSFRARIDELVDFSEDWITTGPSLSALQDRFNQSGLFHVEMFRARAGLHDELLDQRQRENIYYAETGRDGNAIFHAGFGADWDNMTIGFHESMKSFAAGSGLPPEAEEDAAHVAGFDGTADLAPSLRALLMTHHDTFAVKMN